SASLNCLDKGFPDLLFCVSPHNSHLLENLPRIISHNRGILHPQLFLQLGLAEAETGITFKEG
ncbi:MAG: hypothetical protein WAN10_07385, partial [Candidatus Acidiferrales bacterium]